MIKKHIVTALGCTGAENLSNSSLESEKLPVLVVTYVIELLVSVLVLLRVFVLVVAGRRGTVLRTLGLPVVQDKRVYCSTQALPSTRYQVLLQVQGVQGLCRTHNVVILDFALSDRFKIKKERKK